jgi:uncharacterized protein (TIGR02246 family)
MTRENNKATDEAQIREMLNSWATAIRSRNSNGLTASYAPDVLMFDVVNPLQYTGPDAVRKRSEEWLSSFQDPLGYEIRDLNIATGDDVAFCHSLNRVNGTTTEGNKIDMWWRATICFRKIDGKWMVTHEHSSVPFDTKTGKASLDLKP